MKVEERITRLEDIEAIRYLQAKYQRCLDSRDFDELATCFAEDAVSSYGNGKMSYASKAEIIHFLASVMDIKMPSTHLIHGGEIDWLDPNHAKAKWYLEDRLIAEKYFTKIEGAAIYHVEYKKIDGKWLISSIGYERVYEAYEPRGIFNALTLHKKTVLKKIKDADLDSLGEFGRYYKNKEWKKKRKKK